MMTFTSEFNLFTECINNYFILYTNFRKIITNIYTKSYPYNVFSIDITSVI